MPDAFYEIVRSCDRSNAEHFCSAFIGYDPISFLDMSKFPNLLNSDLIPIRVFFEELIPPGIKLRSAKHGDITNFLPSDGYETSFTTGIPVPCIFSRSDLPIYLYRLRDDS